MGIWGPQLLGAFGGALIGGVLSIFGAIFAINEQAKKQGNDREKIALEFIEFIISEQMTRLKKLRDERLKHLESVDQYSLQLSLANYNLYERNREQLIYISDKILRKNISDLLTEIQAHSWVLNTSCNNLMTLNSGGIIPGDAGNTQFNKNAIIECFKDFGDLISRCKGTLNKIQ
jgi:hypothetical protein